MLGKKLLWKLDFLFAITAIICIAIGAYTMMHVPLDTRYPDPDKYGHYAPMQIAFLGPLLMLALFRGRRKPDSHHMGKGSRRFVVVFITVLCILMVWAQWSMSTDFFKAAAAASGT